MRELQPGLWHWQAAHPDWRGTEAIDEVITARTGQVLVSDAPAPGVGWP